MKTIVSVLSMGWLVVNHAHAVETLLQNDSLTAFDQGAIQTGFVAGELAATWLEAPCDGDLIAVQIFWRSLNGGAPISFQSQIDISAAGTFPQPAAILESIVGPFLTDGVFNEFRFLDENNVIPLIVPVTQGETYVVSFEFDTGPSASGPSVVTDVDGCQTGKNAIFAIPPNIWIDSCVLGVSGDFVMRAIVDCPVVAAEVDLAVTQSANPTTYTAGADLSYQIIVSNAGPAAANSTTLIDFFPGDLITPDWMCTATGGATCANATGSGNITESIDLPASSSVTIEAVGVVDISTMGALSNTAQLVVPIGLTDTNPSNNSSTLEVIESTDDLIFADGFE